MRNIRILTALELRSLFGINKFLHTRDRRAKNRYRLLLVAWLIVIGMLCSYIVGLTWGLSYLGMGDSIPLYLTVLAAVLIAAVGLFTAGERVFGRRGYETLAVMPLRPRDIIAARMLALYVEDLILALVVLLPGVTAYGILERPGLVFYPVTVVGLLFIPAIPLVISVLFGTLLMFLTARIRHKSIVQSVLAVAVVIVVLAGSMGMSNLSGDFSPEMLSELACTISSTLGRVYPPAAWLGDAMRGVDPLGLVWLISTSVVCLAIALLSATVCRGRIMQGAALTRRSVQSERVERHGLLRTLYVREAKRYFSSSIYVTNTIIGPILGCILCVSLCVVGIDTVESALPAMIPVRGLIPFAVAAVFGMMTTTCSSISMEGRQFWIIRSLPVPVKALLDSKILLNASLIFPFFAISEMALMIALRPGLMDAVWLITIPVLILLFALVFGITVNLRFYSFDWEREEQVVKQSTSAALGGFAGLLLSIAAGGVTCLVPTALGDLARVGLCVLLAIGTLLLYRRNNQTRLERLG